MKIIVKKNLVIFKHPNEWETISAQLISEYGPSIMISWKMRRELGFTVRRHRGLEKHEPRDSVVDAELRNRYYYTDQIHLDFWSESSLTYFLLKYVNNTSGVDT